MTTPVAQNATLPPDVSQALERNGINLGQIKSYMAVMGYKPQDLPAVLKQAGIEDVPGFLKDQGIPASQMPAILTALGVPSQDYPAMLAELGFTQDPTPADPPSKDNAQTTARSDKRLPANPLTLIPDPKQLLKQAVDRDPAQIEKDRLGLSGKVGLTLHQPALGADRFGVEVGVEKELGRKYLSGDAASGWIMSLGVTTDANLTGGKGGVDLSLTGGFKPFIGKTWGFHSSLLNASTETRVGLYGVAQGGARAGIHEGPNLGLAARVGGGVEAGPLYFQLTRDFATNGNQTQASAGLNLHF